MPLVIGLLGVLLVLGFAGAAAARSAQPLKWSSAKLVDHARPYGDPAEIGGVSCPSQSLCIGVGSHGTVVATRGATTKVVNSGLDSYLAMHDVSCPTTKLCVAIAGNMVLSTTNPGAAKPTWKRERLKVGLGLLETITCPTASLCVAPASTGAVWVSTKPTGERLGLEADDARRPGTVHRGGRLCSRQQAVRGVDQRRRRYRGEVRDDHESGRRRSAWTMSAAPARGDVDQLSVDRAVRRDQLRRHPGVRRIRSAGGASWTAAPVLTTGLGIALTALDCGSASRCTAAVSDGTVLTSSDPAGGAAAWTRSGVLGPNAFGTSNQTAMACRPDGSCLIPYIGGGLANVAFGPPATATLTGSLSGLTEIRGLSCPSKTLCIGVDDAGAVLRSSQAGGRRLELEATLQPAVTNGLNSVSCPRTGFCAAVGDDDTLLTSSTPASASTWQYTKLPFTWEDGEGGTNIEDLGSISCASPTACVATGSVNQLFVSTDPSGGARGLEGGDGRPVRLRRVLRGVVPADVAVRGGRHRGWTDRGLDQPGRIVEAVSDRAARTKGARPGSPRSRARERSSVWPATRWGRSTAPATDRRRQGVQAGQADDVEDRLDQLPFGEAVRRDRRSAGGRGRRTNPSGGRSAWHSVRLDGHDYPTNAGGFGRRLIVARVRAEVGLRHRRRRRPGVQLDRLSRGAVSGLPTGPWSRFVSRGDLDRAPPRRHVPGQIPV